MGTTAHYLRVATSPKLKMKFCLMLSAVLAVVRAEPWYAGLGYGYGVNVAHPTGTSFARVDRLDGLGYGLYGYGRKKRDAEADADAHYGYGGGIALHPTGTSYRGRTVFGYPRGKRSAE